MAAPSILLALVWHMHQPDYVPPGSREAILPWTRLHATKDYRDMVAALEPFPNVRCTFNVTPVLLDQLEAIGAGAGDEALRLARRPAASLTPEERRLLLRDFFSVNRERMLDPVPRYRLLWRRAEEERAGGRPLSEGECRDLQTLFHLAWVDPSYDGVEPIRSLRAKGEGFTEEEKEALLEWGVRLAASVISAYRSAADAGRIEISTSAHHHPILPLLVDTDAPRAAGRGAELPRPPFRAADDAAAQIRSGRSDHERRFGTPPRGAWPPEGAVSDPVLALLRDAGFEWAASDETVLARALALRDGTLRGWPAARYRPYRVSTAHGPIAMVFRDRELSDQIGFVYRHWDPETAAADFVARVRAAGETARAAGEPGGGPPLVTVILDGENCWEGYEADGGPFLASLYGRLERDEEIEAVTVSEALARSPAVDLLPSVPVGSWIRDDLGIWIGHAEKNRAWTALRVAREALVAAGDGATEEAWRALYAAEASDWFWWYGDDHQSAQKETFDRLFRAHVGSIYERLGLPRDPNLLESLRAPRADGGVSRVPWVSPVIDGSETDFYEWRDAVEHRTARAGGAMHRVSSVIAAVRHGVDARNLYIRVDPAPGADRANAQGTIVVPERGVEASFSIEPGGRGAVRWSGSGSVAASGPLGDDGSYASGAIVEIRLPLERLASTREGAIAWRFELSRGGARGVIETVPGEGLIRTQPPPEDLRLSTWSVS